MQETDLRSLGGKRGAKAEFEELKNNTTSTWTEQNGVNGRLFTAANGNSLFLPAAGYRENNTLKYNGSYGYYWSSSLYMVSLPAEAHHLYFDYVNQCFVSSHERDYGLTIRPVKEAQ